MSAALRATFDKWGLEDFAFARHDVFVVAVGAPGTPDEQRKEQADPTHDNEDDAHRVEVEPAGVHGDGEVEDRSNGNEEQAHSDTHVRSTSRSTTTGVRM